MDIKEFKALLSLHFKEANEDTGSFAIREQLLQLVKDRSDDECLDHELNSRIKSFITEDWQKVCKNIKPTAWSSHPQTASLLAVINSLTEGHVIGHNDRCALLYPYIEKQFNAANQPLTLDSLMPLLIFCSRLSGYAVKEDNLITELQSRIKRAKELRHGGEWAKQQTTLTSFFALYFLLQEHCHEHQIKLLLMAAEYRRDTTAEEQGTEAAIVKFLCQHGAESRRFFLQQIDLMVMQVIQNDKPFAHLYKILPENKVSIRHYLSFDEEIYHFTEFYRKEDKRNDLRLFQAALCSVHNGYASSCPERSIPSALVFAQNLMEQIPRLNNQQQEQILQRAILCFYLQEYLHQRKSETSSLFLSLFRKNERLEVRKMLLMLQDKNDTEEHLSSILSFVAKKGGWKGIENLIRKEETAFSNPLSV